MRSDGRVDLALRDVVHVSTSRHFDLECNAVEEVSNVVIQYFANGGVWKTCTSGDAFEFRVGQEVVVHYMEDRPSRGIYINTQMWLDAWACTIGPIFMIILILVWPMDIFGFGVNQ